MSELPVLITAILRSPDPYPYLFDIGQVVRIKKGISNDGQTPKLWDGRRAKVLERGCTPLNKTHVYKLQSILFPKYIDTFVEEEIDRRCARKAKKGDA